MVVGNGEIRVRMWVLKEEEYSDWMCVRIWVLILVVLNLLMCVGGNFFLENGWGVGFWWMKIYIWMIFVIIWMNIVCMSDEWW